MNRGAILLSIAVVLVTGIVGHGAITDVYRDVWAPKRWFLTLAVPRFALPYAALQMAGVLYYVLVICVLYRSLNRMDVVAVALMVLVAGLTELWHVDLFRRKDLHRTARLVFLYLVPLSALQLATIDDGISAVLVATYFVYAVYASFVIERMHQLNKGRIGDNPIPLERKRK